MFALLVGLLFMVVLYWVCYVCVVRHELVMSHNASWQLLRLACLGQAVYIVYIFCFTCLCNAMGTRFCYVSVISCFATFVFCFLARLVAVISTFVFYSRAAVVLNVVSRCFH